MAFGTATAFEYRSGGANTNGGVYDSGVSGAGTDYSLQDAAELSGTDLACSTGSTTVTSATGAFTEAMKGNGLTIASGTNFTASTYVIQTYVDENTITVDRSPAPSGDGSSGVFKVGGAFQIIADAHCELAVAGNKFWIKGNYSQSLAASISVGANAATTADPISINGYTTTRDDNPTGSDRPTIACGTSYVLTTNVNWQVNNINLTGSAASILTTGSSGCTIRNCKSTNISGTPDRSAFNIKGSTIIESEASSTNGSAITNDTNTLSNIIECYMHDSKYGAFGTTYGRFNVIKSVIDTVTTTGLVQSSSAVNTRLIVIDNIFYNGVTPAGIGYDLGTSVNGVIENNIFYGWTTGISDASTNLSNAIRRNDFYNNTADSSNVGTLDASNITTDPTFTDAANGDFTLGSSSPCLNVGFDFSKIGLTGAYKWNIGIDQDDNAVASSGRRSWAA